MKYGLSEKVFTTIIDTLKDFSEIEECKMFGSRALGNFKNGSDIDLVVYGNNIKLETRNKLHYLLNEEKPIINFVDILCYSDIKNENLIKHIDEYGIEIYRKAL